MEVHLYLWNESTISFLKWKYKSYKQNETRYVNYFI